MKLIVGLGNPGEKYEKTRHNLGFVIVERFLRDFEPVEKTVWESSEKFKSDIVGFEWQPKHGELEKVILAEPRTFMNNSGMTVELIASFYKIKTEDIWVIHDDIDLPLGGMRIKLGGSSGGHRGIESIIQKLGTEKFWRFRMGIGGSRSQDGARTSQLGSRRVKDVDDYVLGTFGQGETGKVRELIKRGTKAIVCSLEESLESAMNKFNTK